MQNYMYKKTFGDTLKEKASEYLIGFLAFVIVIIVFYIVIKNWMNGTWFSKLSGSFGRGVGKIPGSCPSGQEKNGALCYPICGKINGVDAQGVGPVCWQKCPSGYRDDGAFCAKPEPYGRGTGRIPDKTCDSGWSLGALGGLCWNGLNSKIPNSTCRGDEEMNGALCYPKCRSGFHAFGCCICSPDCPSGFGADIGVSCTKKTQTRGAGNLMVCESNQDLDAGLCYPKCETLQEAKDILKKNPNAKFKGVGPVCWQV